MSEGQEDRKRDPTSNRRNLRKEKTKKETPKKRQEVFLFFAHLINHHPWRPIVDSTSIVSYQ